MNLLVFLFRFSLFLGTEITVNDKTLKDALQKDRFQTLKSNGLLHSSGK